MRVRSLRRRSPEQLLFEGFSRRTIFSLAEWLDDVLRGAPLYHAHPASGGMGSMRVAVSNAQRTHATQ